MDLKKIFVKDACPTKIGGQAVLEGIMMKGAERSSIALRLPDGRLHIKTEKNKPAPAAANIPIIRGVVVFIASLVRGIRTLMYSADVMEKYIDEEGSEKEDEGKFYLWLESKLGEKGAWNFMMMMSVLIALVVTIGVFVILPTWVTNLLGRVTDNEILMNLAEGVLRIIMFVVYIAVIARMPDIRRTFQFHGAEHKTIHCFENGLELTPGNAQSFYTLHPRCGTSFLMFVMVIALVLFSLLGWPSLLWRIVSRIALLPVVAGLSYELLRWAGRSDNWLVKALSIPGLALQKLTTAEPDDEQLEVAICAMEAVLPAEADFAEEDYGIGICDGKGHITEHLKEQEAELISKE